MDIPLAWALLLYLLVILILFVVAAVNLYHVVRFGTFDRRNAVMVSVFALFFVAVLVLTAGYFLSVDWSVPLHLELPSFSAPTLPTT